MNLRAFGHMWAVWHSRISCKCPLVQRVMNWKQQLTKEQRIGGTISVNHLFTCHAKLSKHTGVKTSFATQGMQILSRSATFKWRI